MQVDPPLLHQSLTMAKRHLLRQQRSEGNLNYQYDWQSRAHTEGDQVVRQAGALWGLALVYHYQGDPAALAACRAGLDFFRRRSRLTAAKGRYLCYPGDEFGHMGTVPLVALAVIELLRCDGFGADTAEAGVFLDELLTYLLEQQDDNGLWPNFYRLEDGSGYGAPSPYFDGETLLALARAARYLERRELTGPILRGAASAYRRHVLLSLRKDHHSHNARAFYHWGSMAYYELAGLPGVDRREFSDIVFYLSDWMLDVCLLGEKSSNTSATLEGLIHAYALAADEGEFERAEKYREAILRCLTKNLSLQAGSPLAGDFVDPCPPDEIARGGVQHLPNQPLLRIDFAQHHLHATLLALRLLFAEAQSAAARPVQREDLLG